MGEFLAEVDAEVAWAIPVAAVLWFIARRFTAVVPSGLTTATAPGPAGRPTWQRARVLVAAATALVGLTVALGWLITSVLMPVRDLDVAIIEWFAANRSDSATAVAHVGDTIGDTSGIIAMVLITTSVAHAVTRRWAPAFDVVAAAVGETSIFLATQSVIS